MPYFRSCVLVASLFAISSAQANVNTTTEVDENPNTLQSLPLLQSLRNINQQKLDYRAPYVHDLNNRYQVRTLFVETQDLPILDIQLTFNAGAARDREIESGLYGVANMAAQLLDEGTPKYNAQQVAAVFEQVGAQFSARAYRDMFIVKLRVLSDPEKLEPALAMMMELLKHATFEKQSIGMVVSNNQLGQKQLKENPSRMMEIQLYRSLYGQHPYAQPINGTNGSIQRIQPKHLQQFREQFLVAQNMNIAITGKMQAKAALNLAERIAGNLAQGQTAAPLPTPITANGFQIVHIPYQSSQAHIVLGHIGTTRHDPDRLALEVANRMLGGSGFHSVLMKELRVKRGYTYGASSSMSFSQAPGVFRISYSTRQDQLMDSIRVAHKALVDFVREPIDPKQLEETKNGLLRAYPNHYSSNASINAQLGSLGFYEQSAQSLSEYSAQLSKISAEDVQAAVRRHLHPEHLTVIVVSESLDKAALEQVLQHNLQTTGSQSLPQVEDIPAINMPPHPEEEVVLPDPVPSDGPASI